MGKEYLGRAIGTRIIVNHRYLGYLAPDDKGLHVSGLTDGNPLKYIQENDRVEIVSTSGRILKAYKI